MIYEELDIQKLSNTRAKVESASEKLNEIVLEIVNKYTADLDEYVLYIRRILEDEDNPPTSMELDNFCMNLAMYIYYASSMQEQLGIKDDISRALYKEVYHSNRDSLEKGTVADKDSLAELASQQEYLTSVLYKRAYTIVKAKVVAAQDLLASIKKVISRRVSELELTRISGGK